MLPFLTACLKQADTTPLTRLPDVLLKPHERKWFEWIAIFQRRFKKPPSLDTFQEEFTNFVPVGSGTEPLLFLLEKTVRERKEQVLDSLSNQLLAAVSLDDKLKIFMQAQSIVRLTDTDTETLKTFDTEQYTGGEAVLTFPYGLIQKVTGGMLRSDYVVIVGRLASLKTTVALDIARQWAKDGARVLFISNEMSNIDIAIRLHAMVAGFNPLRLRTEGYAALKPEIQVAQTILAGYKGDIILQRTRKAKPSYIAQQAEIMGADVIVIDGLYLMKADEPSKSRFENVALVSNAVKQMALDMNLPVLAVTQLSRDGAGDAEITTENIAFSDAIGQDADIILGVKKTAETEKKATIEINIPKNRVGAKITSLLSVNFDKMEITDESVGWV